MWKTKDKSIVISASKTNVPPILGGLGEKKESTTTITDNRTPELWNAYDGVREVYHRDYQSLQDQILKLITGINIDLGSHMEVQKLVSELLGKLGVLWSKLAAEIEVFQLNLVTTTYGAGVGATRKAECWTVVIAVVWVICRELRKVGGEAETVYGSDNPTEMVGQYLWGALQAHRVMDELSQTQFSQHPGMAPHITLYLF